MSILAKRLAWAVPLLLCLRHRVWWRVQSEWNASTATPKVFEREFGGPVTRFSMSGTELCAGSNSFFTRAGTFTADGKGNIVGGLEDITCATALRRWIYGAADISLIQTAAAL